jgi:hypothetical protein
MIVDSRAGTSAPWSVCGTAESQLKVSAGASSFFFGQVYLVVDLGALQGGQDRYSLAVGTGTEQLL